MARNKTIICPRCKAVNEIAAKQTGFFCVCGMSGSLSEAKPPKVSRSAGTRVIQKKIAIEGGIAQNTIVIPEEANQASILRELCRLGYTVLQTSVRFRMQLCEHCGGVHKPNAVPSRSNPTGSNGYGTTPGVPDLMVSHERWIIPVWLAIEVKGSNVTWSKLSDAQKTLYNEGRISIGDCVERAIRYVEVADSILRRIKPEYAAYFRLWE